MHERRRQPLPPRVIDALVVGLVAFAATAGVVVWRIAAPATFDLPLAVPLLLGLAQAAVLWWRRERPLVVLAAALLVLLLAQALGDLNAASFLGPHVAAYSVGAHGRRAGVGIEAWRDAPFALGMLVVAAALDMAVVTWLDDGPGEALLVRTSGLLVVLAWAIGQYVGARRRYVEGLIAHTHRLERQQDERARQAILEERRRIARELHDQVAHHLGVVSLQTAAARRWLHRDVDRTATALEAAEGSVRAALMTMPTILEALRTDDAAVDLAPQATLAELDALVDDVRAAGVPVELRREGATRPLDPAVELAAFRTVQEGLTNVMKHAGPASCVVTVRYDADGLRVEVVDDGRGLAAEPATGSRQGLVGMRERIELVGGTLIAAPAPGGGFRVEAALPVQREVRP
jgi:signal transduction histidine kinase